MTPELLDAVPTETNLRQLLLACAEAAPRPEVDPERQGDGFRAATAILGRADEAGLGEMADVILEDLMRDTDVDRVWLALTFLPLERQATHGLAAMNPHAMHAFAFDTWRLNLGLAVARALLPWQEPYRWLVDGASDLGMFAALLGWDPAFALVHWTTTFGSEPPRATQRLLYAMGELHRDEVVALQAVLEENPQGTPAALAAALAAMAAKFLERSQSTSDHIRDARWTAASVTTDVAHLRTEATPQSSPR